MGGRAKREAAEATRRRNEDAISKGAGDLQGQVSPITSYTQP